MLGRLLGGHTVFPVPTLSGVLRKREKTLLFTIWGIGICLTQVIIPAKGGPYSWEVCMSVCSSSTIFQPRRYPFPDDLLSVFPTITTPFSSWLLHQIPHLLAC